jgi:threonine/homoserine/homoserine lactone efflux protein
MLYYLATGALLGLGAGLSPGPLLALVLSESLRRGAPAGIRVALAPLVSDLPIIALVLPGLGKVAHHNMLPGILALLGGGLVVWMGLGDLRGTGAGAVVAEARPEAHPLRRGVLVNVLSPYPYLFWLGVGGPMIFKAWGQSPAAALAFLGSFYLLLVGSKVLLACVVGRLTFLGSRAYRNILRTLAFLLCLFGLSLVYEGLTLCGLVF